MERRPQAGSIKDPRSIEEAVAILQEMAAAVSTEDRKFSAVLPSAWQEHPLTSQSEDILAGAPQKNLASRTWSERTFQSLLESAADSVVLCDASGSIVLVNSQTEKLFGYRREELLGRRIELLMPNRFRARHIQHRERFFNQLHARSMGQGLELSGRRKDGSEFPVEISLTPLETEGESLVAATVRDVSERKRLEARYVTLVEGIPAVTFMAALDESNNELYVSPQIEQLLGFSQSEWLGDPFLWHRQLHPDDRQRWGEEFARTCASGVKFKSEYRFISRDNREVWVHGEARVVRDEHGRPLFLQGIAFDITEAKRAEQTLRRSAEELEQKVGERTAALQEATIRAELANRARAAFLANMSHEIRTPLNGIIGFSDLLRRNAESNKEERDEWLEIVLSSGKHLLALINDILDLSKIDAGKLQVEAVTCSPAKIVREVCSVLKAKADEKDLRLDAVFEGPIPQTIHSDPTRLRQILINIAGNAIKFTHQGHVRISTRLRRETAGESALVLEISDTGIGIPPDKLDSIFDPFTQADSSITRQFGGTGLGLAISRRLAEHLGGGITVRSEVGRGTTFICQIATGPLSDDCLGIVESTAPTIETSEPESAATPVLNRRVLVVDDADTNRMLINLLLGRAGAIVEEAENGQQAIERVLSEPFDVVLMDMQMPVIDGYTATRELRSRGITIPIIALTANAMKGDEEACQEAGCSGYLTKPIDQSMLMKTIGRFLVGQASQDNAAVPHSAPALKPPKPAKPNDEIVSFLPEGDPDFHEIVVQFVARLREKLEAMRQAATDNNFEEMASLAHWLKGTSGSAGFPDFRAPAEELEMLVRERQSERLNEAISRLEELSSRIVVK